MTTTTTTGRPVPVWTDEQVEEAARLRRTLERPPEPEPPRPPPLASHAALMRSGAAQPLHMAPARAELARTLRKAAAPTVHDLAVALAEKVEELHRAQPREAAHLAEAMHSAALLLKLRGIGGPTT